MTLKDFIPAFHRLRDSGFIRTKRQGPTGVGHTLEQALGLTENNIAAPDLGDLIELKAHRLGVNSMITLFTFNRNAWKMPPLDAIRMYGTFDKNGRQGLYFTMTLQPNSSGLFLYVDKDAISVRHISGRVVAEWQLDQLTEQFEAKIPALILVSAQSEMRGDVEWFHYTRAQLMRGTSPEILGEQIQSGHVLVDLRLHDKGTSARNHGTGFRAFEDKLPLLFERIEDL